MLFLFVSTTGRGHLLMPKFAVVHTCLMMTNMVATRSPLISRRAGVRPHSRSPQKAEHLIYGFGYFKIPLLPLGLGPQALEKVVAYDSNHEADVVVLRGPTVLVGMKDEVLGVAGVYDVSDPGGNLVLLRLRCERALGEEVSGEFMPCTADVDAAEPFVELADVFEGKEFENETLMLLRETDNPRRREPLSLLRGLSHS